jgi:hypothetical protein
MRSHIRAWGARDEFKRKAIQVFRGATIGCQVLVWLSDWLSKPEDQIADGHGD